MSENHFEILPVQLTEEELVNIGNELSGLQIEKEKLESEKAATVKDFNDKIKSKESQISELAHQINAGSKLGGKICSKIGGKIVSKIVCKIGS